MKIENIKKSSARVESIDILKGLVMILMAIDHVRVYSGISASGQDFGVFFTRWITHFCAPGFAFFAGTSIFFMNLKLNNKLNLSKKLIVRGLLLVVLELTIIHFFWTFNMPSTDFVLAGVIWMLGWCMVLMAGFIWLKSRIVGLIGLLIIIFQSAFAFLPSIIPEGLHDTFILFWKFIYPTGFENPQEDSIVALYVIVPWIGVMAIGYGFGEIFKLKPKIIKGICVSVGAIMIFLFVIIGTSKVLLTSEVNPSNNFILTLLNQQKYPASVLFLLMTLGPLILAIPYLSLIKGKLITVLKIFGKVPLFFYIVHILIIHISAICVQFFINGDKAIHNEWYEYAPFTFVPKEFVWSLPLLYFVFLIDIIVLYFLCKWYAKYKSNHPEKIWLRYI